AAIGDDDGRAVRHGSPLHLEALSHTVARVESAAQSDAPVGLEGKFLIVIYATAHEIQLVRVAPIGGGAQVGATSAWPQAELGGVRRRECRYVDAHFAERADLRVGQ